MSHLPCNQIQKALCKKKIDWAQYTPGESIHIDFVFKPLISIHGFTAFLSIKEAATNYTWIFLSQKKMPPLDIVTLFISTNQNIEFLYKLINYNLAFLNHIPSDIL